jgi:uncharacterized membrane protein
LEVGIEPYDSLNTDSLLIEGAPMLEVFQFAAILSCALFAGAALYINLAEHPARMQCGTELAATVFGPSYHRAAAMQVPLALVASVSAIGSWWLDDSLFWIGGALLILAVVPFTLLVILPTNKQLLMAGIDRKSTDTHKLLVRWGRLHAVRTFASLSATIFFLIAVLRT